MRELQIVVHPGAYRWAPSERDSDKLKRRFFNSTLHIWPRSEASRIVGRDLGPYAFRALTRGDVSHVFVDETETPESIAWLSAHELAHASLAKRDDVRQILELAAPRDAGPHDDLYHRLDPEEVWADGIATNLFGKRLDRSWWRKRTPQGHAFGATPSGGPGSWSPAKVLNLRRQGIFAVARAVGRVPGEFIEIEGGINALYAMISKSFPDLHPEDRFDEVLTAIAWQESHGDLFAVSETGALGMMQLTQYIYSDTAPAINPFNATQAIERSSSLMMSFFSRGMKRLESGETTEDPLTRALMAYKEGWRGSFRESKRGMAYAQSVIAIASRL